MNQSLLTPALTEYTPVLYPVEAISYEAGEILWRHYGKQVHVEFPSPITNGQWRLTAQGWVGYIPLTHDLTVALQPKVELGNLFRMLEYAYRLRSFEFLEGLIESDTLEEFYERLARVLAKRVMDRGRKGFYRTYLSRSDELPYVRGQLDIQQSIRTPWKTQIHCYYQEHTADIEDNQILAWTLSQILRSGVCTEWAAPTIRKAHRLLQNAVTLTPFQAGACIGRLYNRLNEDYRPVHALCRFFLEHSGPKHEVGDRTMVPFLVDMARLYELFVAEWLKQNLPVNLELRAQEKVAIAEDQQLHFTIDLVLRDATTGKTLCVLDTKYKKASTPATDDIAQMVAYAEAQGCSEAVLIYPDHLAKPLDTHIGHVRVRSLTFGLMGNLEEQGIKWLEALLKGS